MEIAEPNIDPTLLREGWTRMVIAETQEEYRDLPAIVTTQYQVISRWTLSEEERQAILNGEDIYLTILGLPINPVLLTVGVIDWKPCCLCGSPEHAPHVENCPRWTQT